MEITWKLYSPLQAEFFEKDEYGEIDYLEQHAIQFTGTDLTAYEDSVCEAVDRYLGDEDDLAKYIRDDCGMEHGVQINRKVLSAVPSVESVNGELVGCTTVRLSEPLNEAETDALCDYLTGQYSDGWGEGFEQQEIKVEDGALYVSFWNSGHFCIEIDRNPAAEQAAQRPKLRIDLTGPGGNIYAVVGQVCSALKQTGQQNRESEMCKRVFAADSYEAALAVMGEYMEIEYIRPAQPDRASKPKKKGDDAR